MMTLAEMQAHRDKADHILERPLWEIAMLLRQMMNGAEAAKKEAPTAGPVMTEPEEWLDKEAG